MAAEQGQKYRVLSPQEVWERKNPGKEYRAPRIYGQGDTTRDRYTTVINGEEFVDLFGDVITASENVAYPHGPNDAYRNCRYIDDNAERFELIDE